MGRLVHFTWTDFRRRTLAAGCAVLILTLGLLATSPSLHGKLHAGPHATLDDGCAVALRVKEKKPLESLRVLPAVIKVVEAGLGTRGRVLVRYSGTESKLRLLVEGPEDAVVNAAMQKLTAAARSDLEVI